MPILSTITQRSAVLGLLGLGLLSACETVIDLPAPEHTPRIALKYVLSSYESQNQKGNDELANSRNLFVSNSQRIFDNRENKGRQDATVVVLDGSGAVVERFEHAPPRYPDDLGFYRPTMGLKPQPGQTYTLRASLPGFESVESSLSMPAAPTIESATFVKNDSKSNPNDVYGQLSISVADDPRAANYYVAFARVIDSKNPDYQGWSQVQVVEDEADTDVTSDLGRFQLSSINSFLGYSYGLYPYADTNVNGQRFSLSANVRYYPGHCQTQNNCQGPDYMEVFVSSMTRDTYNFYLSRQRYNETEGNPFAEPAPLASNIKGGFGLFGGTTDAIYRIKLP
ncbi:DUF4249 family protein [Hymenobacter elongatus]|uniref:DUF4249 family protein n=1 Tax=Hymenobacter elongatus TaxID=877208 RepID=A0A4Z0PJV9_9BACT|nr:DUF4249 family protein [Hymenobacter elongatus]TGE14326.1 DUF4249 family protein [Hymenobacter elongatus]